MNTKKVWKNFLVVTMIATFCLVIMGFKSSNSRRVEEVGIRGEAIQALVAKRSTLEFEVRNGLKTKEEATFEMQAEIREFTKELVNTSVDPTASREIRPYTYWKEKLELVPAVDGNMTLPARAKENLLEAGARFFEFLGKHVNEVLGEPAYAFRARMKTADKITDLVMADIVMVAADVIAYQAMLNGRIESIEDQIKSDEVTAYVSNILFKFTEMVVASNGKVPFNTRAMIEQLELTNGNLDSIQNFEFVVNTAYNNMVENNYTPVKAFREAYKTWKGLKEGDWRLARLEECFL